MTKVFQHFVVLKRKLKLALSTACDFLAKLLKLPIPRLDRRSSYAVFGFITSTLLYLCFASIGPGDAVAAMGFVALSIAWVKPPEQKIAGICALALLMLELFTVSSERNKQSAQQGADAALQELRFRNVARDLRDERNKIEDSIQKLNTLTTAARQVENLSSENLKAVTGADAFSFLYPDTNDYSQMVQWKVHNQGKYSLDVIATIHLALSGFQQPGLEEQTVLLTKHTIGPLAPHEGRIVDLPPRQVNWRSDGFSVFRIWLNAQNRGISEVLVMRPSSNGRGISYKFLVFTEGTQNHRGDLTVNGILLHCLRVTDWVAPPALNQPDNFRPWEERHAITTPCSISHFFEDLPKASPR